jgi:hypothetical protein
MGGSKREGERVAFSVLSLFVTLTLDPSPIKGEGITSLFLLWGEGGWLSLP